MLSTAKFWNDRRIQIFELLLICFFAAGLNWLKSAFTILGFSMPGAGNGPGLSLFNWIAKIAHDSATLALLWYVLQRRSKSFSDIGCVWRWSDLFWSFPIWLAGSSFSTLTYRILYYAGISDTNRATTVAAIGNYLFHDGVLVVTLLGLVLNPFFEELILRAYLMTELKQLTGSSLVAILVSTVLETVPHLYQGTASALSLLPLFLVFSIYFAKTNRIFPLILAHWYGDNLAYCWYRFPHH